MNIQNDNNQYNIRKPNRHKKQEPRAHKAYWCNCDRALIRDGEKCPACKHRKKSKKLKKIRNI